MSRVFLIADTHFEHRNILKYENRPWASVEEMNAALIENWNKVVRDNDVVYHLGDVSMSKWGLRMALELKGRKILLRGNHDNQKLKEYIPVFEDIRASKEMNGYLLTHFPVHPSQSYRYKGNIHGHTHSKAVKNSLGEDDLWYFSVSVENIGYTPIFFEEVLKRMKERALKYERY